MNSLTLNEIAQNIINLLRGGRSSNTENLSFEEVKFLVKHYRATFLRRDFARNNNRIRMFEQDLGHVSVSSVDSAEDATLSSGNLIWRTDNQLPTPIRLKNSQGITHISSKDKVSEPIPLLEDNRSFWQQFSKYTASSAYATYRNGYLYIFNDLSLQTVNIRGVFEDPEQVYNFVNPTAIEPYDGSQPFPISSDMIEGITKGLLNGELKVAVTSLNDDETDLTQDEQ